MSQNLDTNIDWDYIRQQDLAEFILDRPSLGYIEINKESTRKHRIFKKGNSEKLKITMKPNGDYLYMDLYDDSKRGNIYNFLVNSVGLDQGKETIEYIKEAFPEAFPDQDEYKESEEIRKSYKEKIEKQTIEVPKVIDDEYLKAYAQKEGKEFKTVPVKSFHPFDEFRDIPVEVLEDKFSNVEFFYRKKNLDDGTSKVNYGFAYPLANGENRLGIALNNVNFGSRSYMVENSLKEFSLWSTKNKGSEYFLTEDPKDALGHKAIYNKDNHIVRYFATIGRYAPQQLEVFKNEAIKDGISTLNLGFDNDPAGIMLTIDCLKHYTVSNEMVDDVPKMLFDSLSYNRKTKSFEFHNTTTNKKHTIEDTDENRKHIFRYLKLYCRKAEFVNNFTIGIQVPITKDFNDDCRKFYSHPLKSKIYELKNKLDQDKISCTEANMEFEIMAKVVPEIKELHASKMFFKSLEEKKKRSISNNQSHSMGCS